MRVFFAGFFVLFGGLPPVVLANMPRLDVEWANKTKN